MAREFLADVDLKGKLKLSPLSGNSGQSVFVDNGAVVSAPGVNLYANSTLDNYGYLSHTIFAGSSSAPSAPSGAAIDPYYIQYSDSTGCPVFWNNRTSGRLAFNILNLTTFRALTVPDASGTIALTSDLSSYLTSATAASTYQPLDGDLTAIAALATASFGRSLLTQASAAAAATTLGVGTGDSPQFTRLGLNTAASSLFHLAANGAAMVRHQSVTISGSTYTFDVGVASEFTCGAAINGATTFALNNHDQLPAAVSGVGWRTRAVVQFTWTSGTITFSAAGYTFSQAAVTLTSGQTYNAILTITSNSTVIGVQYTLGRT